MPSDLMKHVTTHLEFLGYTLTPLEGETDVLRVTHPDGFTFSFFATEHVFRFASNFAIKKWEKPGCLKFINSLNLVSKVASFCKTDFNTFVCQCVFYGAYTKANFSLFLNAWVYDMDLVLRERAEEFFTYVE